MKPILLKFLKVLPVVVSLIFLSAAPSAAERRGPFPLFAKRGGHSQHGGGLAFISPSGHGFPSEHGGPSFGPSGSGGRPFPALIIGTVVTGVVANAGSSPGYDVEETYSDYARPEAWSKAWFRACSARNKTFDPESGTYMGRKSKRRFCQGN